MNRRAAMLILLILLLWGAVLLAAGHMVQQQSDARTAERDLADCRRWAEGIRRCRNLPETAADRVRHSGDIQGAVEREAAAAGVPLSRIVDIAPQPPVRIEDTVYKERPTLVRLEGVTSRQLAAMLHGLSSAKNGLHPKTIHLRQANGSGGEEQWHVDTTLTSLLYDPPSDHE